MVKNFIRIEEGNGGSDMNNLLNLFLKGFYRGSGNWSGFNDDSATFKLDNKKEICFTTDSFIVKPIKFPGGNIGHLAACGVINDLVVMGCDPIGLSCALVIEEGFSKKDLKEVLDSMNKIAREVGVPIVTGDTKIMEKGSLDGIIINMSGIGLKDAKNVNKVQIGDKIVISGGIGEHGVALLSSRFDFETNIISDSKPLIDEMNEIRDLIKFAKDPTRGGIASSLNEISDRFKIDLEVIEDDIPIKKEVKSACNLLGIDVYSLANEGRLICVVDSSNANEVVKKLKKFNNMACVIGKVVEKDDKNRVILKTSIGKRVLGMPSGKIVPRIC